MLTPDPPDVPGGVSGFVRVLQSRLVADGHDVRLLALSSGGRRPPSSALVGYVRRVCKEAAAFEPDVVHAHATWQTATPFFFVNRSRTIFTVHSEPALNRWRTRTAMGAVLSKASVATTVSEYMKRVVESHLPGARIRVVPPAVEPMSEKPAKDDVRARIELPGAAFVVASVSPMVYPEKVAGLHILLQALRLTPADTHVVIAGGGPLLPHLRVQARELGVHPRTHFLGSIQDVAPVFAVADVYVQASLRDNMPLALLEAMAAGLPAVSFPIGGVPEVIRNGVTGFLSVPDPTSLASILTTIRANSDRSSEVAQAGKAEVLRRFTWSAVRPQWEQVYGGIGS